VVGPAVPTQWDVFLCHASEDKAELVEPLVAALRKSGLEVWYDRDEIRVGDDFRARMNDGLRRARFGVVMVSLRRRLTTDPIAA
jgi:TIR domain